MKKIKPFILDCSIAMTWLFSEQATTASLSARDALLSTHCYVPSIWPLEINNVLWVAVRSKKITDLQAKRFKYILKNMAIEIDFKASDLMNDVIFELSSSYNISCYDASYLELAIRENLSLATLDKTLAKAAVKAGVGLFDN